MNTTRNRIPSYAYSMRWLATECMKPVEFLQTHYDIFILIHSKNVETQKMKLLLFLFNTYGLTTWQNSRVNISFGSPIASSYNDYINYVFLLFQEFIIYCFFYRHHLTLSSSLSLGEIWTNITKCYFLVLQWRKETQHSYRRKAKWRHTSIPNNLLYFYATRRVYVTRVHPKGRR